MAQEDFKSTILPFSEVVLVLVVVVQTNNHVKPTTELLWVAFGLGCCCFAWLWGYDNILSASISGVINFFAHIWLCSKRGLYQTLICLLDFAANRLPC